MLRLTRQCTERGGVCSGDPRLVRLRRTAGSRCWRPRLLVLVLLLLVLVLLVPVLLVLLLLLLLVVKARETEQPQH